MSVASTPSSPQSGPTPGEAQVRIALIGYGEVGQTLAGDLRSAGFDDLCAWDRLFPDPSSLPSIAAAKSKDVRAAAAMAAALDGRTLVICAVTAGDCLSAAREAATSIAPQAFYFDLNSVSPHTRREAASVIEAAGARYVEAAVMSPIAPRRIASPMLIGGPHAKAFAPLARMIGFSGVRIFGASVGQASAVKMCRSVLVKGLEALLTESLLAARRYGIERTVLESLQDLFPNENWEVKSRYFISRSLQHGARRAEEMQEAARTVAEVGVKPTMSLACAERQAWAAARRPLTEPASLSELLDLLLMESSTRDLESA
jgi:3-hydroxyisobutyrate dehydrogenase-like beta-hydroxyacid dehydrogenase